MRPLRRATLRGLLQSPALSPLRQTLVPLTGLSNDHEKFNARSSSSLALRSVVASKGPGGRSSVSGVVAVVFGATGFLGRYVVQYLARTGTQVVVPYRCLEDQYKHLKIMGDLGQIVPLRFDVRSDDSIAAAMGKANVVINLMGRDFETRNFSFADINVDAAARIARLAREHGGIVRLVQMSCLGASTGAPSEQHRTKAQGEAATLQAFPDATILRAAPFVGTEDRFLNSWAIQAKKLPAVPVIGGGQTRMQPVHVKDAAGAVCSALLDDGTSCGKTYELGGPDVYTITELIHLVYDVIRQRPSIVDIPLPVAKMLATPRELLLRRVGVPIPAPTMFTMDYINSLSFDHVVSPTALTLADLGVEPQKLKGTAIDFLHSYRSGGPQYGDTMGERTSGAGF